jgi:cell shape-determining protein MreD
MKRGLLVFATLILLWLVAGLINQGIAGAHLHVFCGGLFVTYAAVALPPVPGLVAVVLAGGVCDAHAPLPFGTEILLFALAHALLRQLRDRVPHDDTVGRVAIALLCNLGLFLALSFLCVGDAPNPAAYWGRSLVDLVLSQLALCLIAPWFFALQELTASYARE